MCFDLFFFALLCFVLFWFAYFVWDWFQWLCFSCFVWVWFELFGIVLVRFAFLSFAYRYVLLCLLVALLSCFGFALHACFACLPACVLAVCCSNAFHRSWRPE